MIRFFSLIIAQPLFWCHVGARTRRIGNTLRYAAHRRADFSGKTKVENASGNFAVSPCLYHHVRGLDVAVKNFLFMRIIKGGCDLARDLKRLIYRNLTFRELLTPLRERNSRRVLHYNECVAFKDPKFFGIGLVVIKSCCYWMQSKRCGYIRMMKTRN